jgi:uncharacterized protein
MKRALLLLGGTWHDFDGFARALGPMLEPGGWTVEPTYDLDRLTRLEREKFDLVVSYTCFTLPAEGVPVSGPAKMTGGQVEALADWVRRGGPFLAMHAATSLGESDPALGKLIGGVFIEHPPRFAFPVHPVYGEHPITAGVAEFSVFDEMYIERIEPGVDVHMATVHAGVVHPLVWSKSEGRGRVAHIAMGHSGEVWELEPYRRLILQAAGWVGRQS